MTHHIRHFLALLFICLTLTPALAVEARPLAPIAILFASEADDLRSRLADTEKDFAVLRAQFEGLTKESAGQEKRIRDIQFILTILGTLITLSVAGLGWFSYNSAQTKAKETASTAVEEWITKDGRRLLDKQANKIVKEKEDELNKLVGSATEKASAAMRQADAALGQASELLEAISGKHKEVGEHAEDILLKKKEVYDYADEISKIIETTRNKDASPQNASPQTEDKRKQRDERTSQIDAKPESEWTFADWIAKGVGAYHGDDMSTAESSFDKAAGVEGAAPDQVAMALVAKGAVLGEMKRDDEAVAAYEQVEARFGSATEPALRERVARALFNKGFSLGKLERYDEEIAAYEQVEARFGSATEPALRERVAKALVNKGVALERLERFDEAVAAYDQVEAHFGSATEPALREQVAMALINKGVALGTLKRDDEAMAAYEQVEARFGSATDPALPEQVAMALVNKGVALGKLKRDDEAVTAYEQVEVRFGSATEPALREQVAEALVNKGYSLGKLERYDEEIAAYGQVEARFGSATEPALREQVARALVNKGVALGKLGRDTEAVAAYEQVEARFGSATEPALREQVARARNNKGDSLLIIAKKNWHSESERTHSLTQAFESIEKSLSIKPDDDITLGNRGYIQFLLGRESEARVDLRRAFELGGEMLKDGELADADRHPVPRDAAFKALVHEVWDEVANQGDRVKDGAEALEPV
ncbi:MAG: hypothetical protein H7840_04460 [Alphaproteobacteria bacterium]